MLVGKIDTSTLITGTVYGLSCGIIDRRFVKHCCVELVRGCIHESGIAIKVCTYLAGSIAIQ